MPVSSHLKIVVCLLIELDSVGRSLRRAWAKVPLGAGTMVREGGGFLGAAWAVLGSSADKHTAYLPEVVGSKPAT